MERGYVVLLDAHRSDLRDLAAEALVLERFHLDASGLSKIDFADIALVDFAIDVNLLHIAEGHDKRCRGAQDQNGTDSVANFYVTREDNAVDGRDDRRVIQLFGSTRKRRFVLRHLGLSLLHLGLTHDQLRACYVAFVHRHLIVALGIVERGSRNYSLGRHALGSFIGTLQSGNIYAGRVDLPSLNVGFRSAKISFRRAELSLVAANLGLELLFVEFSENLTLLYTIPSVHQQFLHDPAGLGLHLNLGNRLHFARCHNALGQVAFLDARDLRRINLRAAAGGFRDHPADEEHNKDGAPNPPKAPFLLLMIRIAVRHFFLHPCSWLHTRVIGREFLNIFLWIQSARAGT